MHSFRIQATLLHIQVVNKIFSPVGESDLLKGAAQVFEAGKRSGEYHDNMDLRNIFKIHPVRIDKINLQIINFNYTSHKKTAAQKKAALSYHSVRG